MANVCEHCEAEFDSDTEYQLHRLFCNFISEVRSLDQEKSQNAALLVNEIRFQSIWALMQQRGLSLKEAVATYVQMQVEIHDELSRLLRESDRY